MKAIWIAILSLGLGACATVPTVSDESVAQLKQVPSPKEGMAGLYVYRSNSTFGAALKKDIWVDGDCLGESARGVFFYKEVEGNKEHTLATESEFSPNLLVVDTSAGKNYFVQQSIKMGAFVGGSNLKVVDEQTGREAIQKLSLAQPGQCSKPFPENPSK